MARRENHVKGTRQNDPVTSGEGVLSYLLISEEANQSEWRQGKEERRNSTKKEKGTRPTIMSEVREFLLIGSLRRETEGIMK
jgi:hypothetical protein